MSPRRADWRLLAPLLLLSVAAYANALDTPFQFDDFVAFADYAGTRDLAHWWAAMPGIRPLLKLSYALNGSVGDTALGYHLANLALHLVNTLMVFLLLRRWPGTPLAAPAAALGAALFALHPAQTEAVSYLAGRSMSLMACCSLAACLAWRAERRLAAAVLFAAALASKESAAVLPAVLLLWARADQPAGTTAWGAALRRTAPLWGTLIAGLFVMAMLARYRTLFAFSLELRDPFSQALAVVRGVAYLIGHPLLTLRLNIDPALPAPTAATPLLLAQGAALLGLAGAALAGLRRAPGAALAVLWFFLHLAPTHSLLPRLDLANDRQLYLALVGPAWLLAAGYQHLVRRAPRTVAALALAAVLALAGATAVRNHAYRSEVALWFDTVRKSPHSPRAWNNLGYALRLAGEDAMAAAAYQRALTLDPTYAQARINLAALLARRSLPRPNREADRPPAR